MIMWVVVNISNDFDTFNFINEVFNHFTTTLMTMLQSWRNIFLYIYLDGYCNDFPIRKKHPSIVCSCIIRFRTQHIIIPDVVIFYNRHCKYCLYIEKKITNLLKHCSKMLSSLIHLNNRMMLNTPKHRKFFFCIFTHY